MVQLKSFAIANFIAIVLAHQNLHEVFINGVSVGYEVGIRKAPSNNPVDVVTSNDLACNVGGTSGAGVTTLQVKAGDSITVAWDQSTHPGPITHFLYGPVASASSATGLGEWAKIDELNYVDGKWANEIMSANGMKHTFTIPTGVASGEYLLRSEMLALHGSVTLGGAQFYIGCIQIKVTNASGGGACSPKISLPGNYQATDPNILIPNFYYGFVPSTYKAPGGPVATCGSGGSSPVTTTRAVTTTAAAVPTTTTLVTTTVRTTTAVQPATTSASSGGVGSPLYGQCGGIGWTGPTTCAQGRCVANGQYYSQCVV